MQIREMKSEGYSFEKKEKKYPMGYIIKAADKKAKYATPKEIDDTIMDKLKGILKIKHTKSVKIMTIIKILSGLANSLM